MRCVDKNGEAKETTDDVTTWSIRLACWIIKTTCRHAHAYAHAPGHTHTHTQMCNTYCFSMATMIRERALILCYTYIVCLNIYFTL
jgi:hypothetical protein